MASENESSGNKSEIRRLIKEHKKLEAIKLIREQSGGGLKEAKDQADAIQSEMIANGEMEAPKGCTAMILLFIAGLSGSGLAAWTMCN